METRREDMAFTEADRPPGRRGLNLRGLIQALVGIGALGLLIYKADARGLLKAINDTKLAYLPLAVIATVTVNWLPFDSDDDERRVFDNNLASMNGGWGGTFEQLAAYLGEVQKGA